MFQTTSEKNSFFWSCRCQKLSENTLWTSTFFITQVQRTLIRPPAPSPLPASVMGQLPKTYCGWLRNPPVTILVNGHFNGINSDKQYVYQDVATIHSIFGNLWLCLGYRVLYFVDILGMSLNYFVENMTKNMLNIGNFGPRSSTVALEFGILDMLGIFGAQWLNSFGMIGRCKDAFLFTSCEKWPNSKMKLVQRRVLHEPVCCPSNFQRYDEVWLWRVNLGTSRHSGSGEKVQSRGWFGNEILDFELMQKVGLFVNASFSMLSNKQNTYNRGLPSKIGI